MHVISTYFNYGFLFLESFIDILRFFSSRSQFREKGIVTNFIIFSLHFNFTLKLKSFIKMV